MKTAMLLQTACINLQNYEVKYKCRCHDYSGNISVIEAEITRKVVHACLLGTV